MEQNQIAIIKREMQVEGTKVMATSKAVAFQFGKAHKNVLRDIESLEIPEDFNQLNFEPVKYLDEKGENRKMYTMTRDGFTLLVMGYTGKKAMEIKIAYIQAFNEMEAELSARREAPAIPSNHRLLPSDRYIELLESENSLLKIGRCQTARQNSGGSGLPYFQAPIPKAEKDTIVAMYAAGVGPTEIGRRVGRSQGSISGLINRARKAVQ